MKPNLIKRPKLKKNTASKLTVSEVPETGELEIQKQATDTRPAKKVRFPKETAERYKLKPKEFTNVQNAIEAYQFEDRQI